MVYLKVSDGSETRRFQVNPGDFTFDQLKDRLSSLFPTSFNSSSNDQSTNLSLQYRDKDGDIITLSSDQELQEALSQLPEEAVWKLNIRKNPHTQHRSRHTPAQHQRAQRRCHNVSLFDHLFEPAWRPFGGLFSNPWTSFERELSETLQLVNTLEEHLSQQRSEKESSANAAAKSETTEESQGETKLTPEQSEENPDEVVKSKLETPKSTGEQKNEEPQYHVRHWGVWEPRVFVSPFGFRTVGVGPVGYCIRWGPQTCGGKKEEKKEETLKEDQTKTEKTEEPAEPQASDNVETTPEAAATE